MKEVTPANRVITAALEMAKTHNKNACVFAIGSMMYIVATEDEAAEVERENEPCDYVAKISPAGELLTLNRARSTRRATVPARITTTNCQTSFQLK